MHISSWSSGPAVESQEETARGAEVFFSCDGLLGSGHTKEAQGTASGVCGFPGAQGSTVKSRRKSAAGDAKVTCGVTKKQLVVLLERKTAAGALVWKCLCEVAPGAHGSAVAAIKEQVARSILVRKMFC